MWLAAVNVILLSINIVYIGTGALLFVYTDADGKGENEERAFENHWDALSYTLSMLLTIGEGFQTCETHACKLLTIYYGLLGIFILYALIAVTAINISKLWRLVLKRVCFRNIRVGAFFMAIFLVVLYYALFMALPTLLIHYTKLGNHFREDFRKHDDDKVNMLTTHYVIFQLVTTVGFGDIKLLDDYTRYIGVYCWVILAHCFLGSIIAFLSHVFYMLGYKNQGPRTRTYSLENDMEYRSSSA